MICKFFERHWNIISLYQLWNEALWYDNKSFKFPGVLGNEVLLIVMELFPLFYFIKFVIS